MLLFIHFLAMAGSGQQQQSGGNPLGFFLPIILIFIIMYFLMFRPQAKKQKELRKMLDSLQKGDRVITIGGILGVVAGLREKDNVVILKVADNVKIEVTKTAIARKLGEGEAVDKS